MVKDDDYYINLVFDNLKGQVKVGDIVGINSSNDFTAYRLTEINDDIGICKAPGHPTRYYPISDLADVNRVKSKAVRLLS